MTDFLIAYWLHSTVLLATTWGSMKIARTRSPVFRERLWKLAAVLPVATALCVSAWPLVALPLCDRIAEQKLAVFPPHDTEASRSPSVGEILTDDPKIDQPAVVSEVTESNDSIDVVQKQNEISLSPTSRVVEPEVDESRLIDEVAPDNVPGTEILSNVAAIAPRDAPLQSSDSSDFQSDRKQLKEGSSRGAMMATFVAPAFDWQPIWEFVSLALCSWMWIGMVWLVIRTAWFRRRLRTSRRLNRGRAIELLRELSFVVPPSGGAARFCSKGAQRTRVLIVPGFSEPAAFGIWQPTIVLPPSCESLDRESLRAVLAHELGHIVRGDLWWLAIGRVLTTIFGFQPLNRIARREWTAAAECLCDTWAVDRGIERLTLARCLTALAEHRLTGVSLADALAAVGSPSSLRTRIERLVADSVVDPWTKRSRRWLLSSSVIAAATVSAVMLPQPKALTASVPRPSGSGLHEDHIQREPPADGRGTELIHEIETELTALRSELSLAERFAEQQSEPQWLDAAEQLRDRERQLVERWRVLKNESGPVQEPGTLIDADHH